MLVFLQQSCLFMALYRLSSFRCGKTCVFLTLNRDRSADFHIMYRTLMFAHFAKLWVAAFLSTSYVSLFFSLLSNLLTSLTFVQPNKKTLAVAVAAGLSLLFDSQFSPTTVWRYIPGYGALVLHGLVTSALDHTLSLVAPSLGETFVMSAAIFVASIVALPFYAFKTMVVCPPSPTCSFRFNV